MKLTIHLDRGLAAHLRALAKGGWIGGTEDTAVYLIRTQIIEYMSNQHLRECIEPQLPKRYRNRGRVYQKGEKQ